MHWIVTVGDPAGVGPAISAAAAAEILATAPPDARITLVGSEGQIGPLLAHHGVHRHRGVDLIDIGRLSSAAITTHEATAEGGEAQFRTLKLGLEALASSSAWAKALVTAPMSKHAVNLSGRAFTGHTEFLAQAAGLEKHDVTMMFLGPRLNVALVTTHVPLANVSQRITPSVIRRTVLHAAEMMSRLYPDATDIRRLWVAGLNPHAGENGLLGEEETNVILPVLSQLKSEAQTVIQNLATLELKGAETAFRFAVHNLRSDEHAAVIAMYHDQATIASKLLDWEHAVNVTWGLPFVRTSVDHGVAYAAARSGQANHQGMLAAMKMAQQLSSTRSSR